MHIATGNAIKLQKLHNPNKIPGTTTMYVPHTIVGMRHWYFSTKRLTIHLHEMLKTEMDTKNISCISLSLPPLAQYMPAAKEHARTTLEHCFLDVHTHMVIRNFFNN